MSQLLDIFSFILFVLILASSFLFFHLSFSSHLPPFIFFVVNTSSPFQHPHRRLCTFGRRSTPRLNLLPKHTETHEMDTPRESKSSKRIKAEYSELKLHPHNGIHAGKFARMSLSTMSSLVGRSDMLV